MNDKFGNFILKDFSKYKYLYYPLCNHKGLKSSITPTFNGDSKLDQHHFLLAPSSSVDLLNNNNSRNLWFTVDSKPWSITGESLEQKINKDDELVTYGYLYQEVTRTNKKFTVKITSFVPEGTNIEMHKAVLTNISENNIDVEPFLAAPLYGRSADNIRDHRHVTSLLNRVSYTKNSVTLKPTLSFDERGHNKNKINYNLITSDINGISPIDTYTDLESYIGTGSFFMPGSIYNKEKNHKRLSGHEVVAGFKYSKYVIPKNESITIVFGLSAGEVLPDLGILDEFDTLLNESKNKWATYSNNLSFNCKHSNILKTVTIQPVLRRIYGCSFLPHHDYGKGGRGWRDLWQDTLALIIMDNNSVHDMLLNNFKGVRIDGSNATIIGDNPGEFKADRNGIPRVWMDHGAWPLITVDLYTKYNNDYGFYLENTNYFRDAHVSLSSDISTENVFDDNILQVDKKPYNGTVIEHLLLENMIMYYNVGTHNFMRLMGADWNDAMDMASEFGESVAFTSLYALNYKTLVDVLINLNVKEISLFTEFVDLLNKPCPNSKESKHEYLDDYFTNTKNGISGVKTSISVEYLIEILNKMHDNIRKNINETEWLEDDSYFNGYYDNSKNQLEGKGNMILTSEVFPIMSGIASDSQVKRITKSADKLLYDKKVGGYKLNTNFNELKDDMGRLFGFSYGTKENGAVFSHMSTMYAYALYSRGFVAEGYKVIKALLDQVDDFSTSETLPGLPEYFDGEGKGLYGYLTGSASWLILTITKEVFGVYLNKNELIIKPKLSLDLFINQKVEERILLSEKHVNITYLNKENLDYGEYKVSKIKLDNIEKEHVNVEDLKEDSNLVITLSK